MIEDGWASPSIWNRLHWKPPPYDAPRSRQFRYMLGASQKLFRYLCFDDFPRADGPTLAGNSWDDRDHTRVRSRIPRPAWQAAPLCAPTRIASLRSTRPSRLTPIHASLSGRDQRPVLRRTAKAGTLAALAAEFFSSTEFANLRPSSQTTYRVALAPSNAMGIA